MLNQLITFSLPASPTVRRRWSVKKRNSGSLCGPSSRSMNGVRESGGLHGLFFIFNAFCLFLICSFFCISAWITFWGIYAIQIFFYVLISSLRIKYWNDCLVLGAGLLRVSHISGWVRFDWHPIFCCLFIVMPSVSSANFSHKGEISTKRVPHKGFHHKGLPQGMLQRLLNQSESDQPFPR